MTSDGIGSQRVQENKLTVSHLFLKLGRIIEEVSHSFSAWQASSSILAVSADIRFSGWVFLLNHKHKFHFHTDDGFASTTLSVSCTWGLAVALPPPTPFFYLSTVAMLGHTLYVSRGQSGCILTVPGWSGNLEARCHRNSHHPPFSDLLKSKSSTF